MSTHGDPSSPNSDNTKKPSEPDFDKTLPEGAFDQTLPEGALDEDSVGRDDQTMVEDGSSGQGQGEGATMIGIGDEPGVSDDAATMVESSAAARSDEDDFGKTLPEGALAGSDSAADDFADKTMVMDVTASGADSEDDFGKTLPEGALNQPVESSDSDKTMVIDVSSSADEAGDDFGKTIQADSFIRTMADDGSIAPEEDFDGKTVVGVDSAAGEEFPQKPNEAAQKTISSDSGQVSSGSSVGSGGTISSSRATRAGGRTSVVGAQAGGTGSEGIEKENLHVAVRSISGLQYGSVPRVDFKLVKQLGEGGMGVVYVAKQASLGREVVFKTLKPIPEAQATKLKNSGTYNSVVKHRTDMFLSEAVVTADLYHPNIVPIYELAESPDGSLFYTMKWVRGIGWNKRMPHMTLEENLEALMKVSDAVAFAHSRHVVNRDLKPENVMLGEYGETIVLDWGLALPFGEGKGRLPLATTAGLGSGTPAYMPPELITGPLNKIGPGCDIYLLGAILFEIITGQPPHDFSARPSGGTLSAGAKMAEIRRVVVENIIRETNHKGELMDIAMKAMATKAEDRYRSVVEFQQAIREYQKHASSRTLMQRAKELTSATAPGSTPPTTEAKSTISYANYQNALALYNEALREWPGNQEARAGLTAAQLDFAELALSKGDLDLGLSVLDTNAESHAPIRARLAQAIKERENRGKLIRVLKVAAAVLFGAVFLLSAVAAKFQFNLQEAQRAFQVANEAKEQAERDKTVAENLKQEAELAAEKARMDLVAAEKAKQAADLAKQKAEEDLIVANMATKAAEAATKKAEENLVAANLAKMKAEEATLKAKADLALAEKAKADAEKATKKAEENLALANEATKKAEIEKDNASYLAGLAVANRLVQEHRYMDARRKLQQLKADYADRCKAEWDQLWNTVNAPQSVSLSKPVESIGLSDDGRKLVATDNAGNVLVWSLDETGKIVDPPIRKVHLGSRPRVVAMSPRGDAFAAAGEDQRIVVWSMDETPAAMELKGHTGAVNTLKFSADGQRIVSGGDDRIVRIWSLAEKRELGSAKVMYAVRCLDWSRDGKYLVVGTSAPADVSGVAYSFEVRSRDGDLELEQLRTFQVPPEGRVKQDRGVVAIALTVDGHFAISNGPAAELHLWRVDLRGQDLPQKLQKVNVESIKLGSHTNRVERVRSLSFSADGKRLLASGDDGTISIWNRGADDGDFPTFVRERWLYGHGGPVRGCLPLPQSSDLYVSGSYDQHLFVWNLKTYLKSREWLDTDEALPSQPAALQDSPPSSQSKFSESNSRDTGCELDNSGGSACSPDDSSQDAPAAAANTKVPTVQIVTGHTDSVLSAVFSRNGERVLSASRDQTARAWLSENGKPVMPAGDRAADFDDNLFAEGHEYDLFAMRFFPDGQRLLTSGFDGTMRIWDARIDEDNSFGRELATLPETGMYGVVKISRDGEWILTAGRKNSAQLWNLQAVLSSRRPRPTRLLDGAHRFRVTTVAISPDSSLLLTGDREGLIVFWNAKTGKVVGRQRNSHIGEVTNAEFLGDGTQILTAGVDRRVVLWKVVESDAGVAIQRQRQFDHEGMVVNLAVSPQNDRFVSVVRRALRGPQRTENGATSKLSLWNIGSGEEKVIELPGQTENPAGTESAHVPVPAWAADGRSLVFTATDGTLHFYDANAGRVTRSLQVDNSDGGAKRARPSAAILLPHEPTPKHIVTQTHNAAFLWRLDTGENLVSFRPLGPVFSAGYSFDGQFVVTGGRSVRIFEARENLITYGRPLHKVEYAHQGVVTSVEFSPASGSYRFLTTSYDETAKIWEWIPDRQFVQLVQELKGHDGPVRFGTWSADGARVLTVGHDARPRVWSFPENQPPTSIVLELPQITAQADANGNAVANPRQTVPDLDQLCGAFSWDGRYVAVGGRDVDTGESIGWIWNLAPELGKAPALHATIRGHGLGGINSIFFLPDDDRLLTAGADGTCRMWDWRKGQVPDDPNEPFAADFLITLVRPGEATTHRGAVTSVRATRDGRIVTASSDGTVVIWPK